MILGVRGARRCVASSSAAMGAPGLGSTQKCGALASGDHTLAGAVTLFRGGAATRKWPGLVGMRSPLRRRFCPGHGETA